MKTRIGFLSLILIALVPRFLELFSSQTFFSHEQGHLYLTAKQIVFDNEFPLVGHEVGGIGGFSKGAGFYYLLLLPFVIFRGDPLGGRLFMFFISVFTVILSFILFKKIFDKKSALIITFLIAVSPALSVLSGRIFAPDLIPLLSVIFIYFIAKFFENDKKSLIPAWLIVGLMAHFEIATSGVLFIGMLILSFVYVIKRRVTFKLAILSLTLFALTFAPMAAFELINKFQNLKGFFSFMQIIIDKETSNYLGILVKIGEVFSWNLKSSFVPSSLSFFLIFLSFIFSIKFYGDKKIKKAHKSLAIFLFSQISLSIILFSFYPGRLDEWWFLQNTVFYIVLVGFFLSRILDSGKLKYLVYLILLVIAVAFVRKVLWQYKFNYPYKVAQPTQVYAVNQIYVNSGNQKFSYEVRSERKSFDDYEYLFWWLGSRKYKNLPSHKKLPNHFIIIEKAGKPVKILRDGILPRQT